MLTPVAPGELAAIVTSLEMRERPEARALPASPFRLERRIEPATAAYRDLFRRVGAPWLWFSRLAMSDAELEAIIRDPRVEIYAPLDPADAEVGIVELDFRQPRECEIAFFGLVPELAGKGHGDWLMAQTLALGWRGDVQRIWVHTCTLDHPRALDFYRRNGFVPFARAVESFADPRLLGILPSDAAPQIPLLGPSS